jgi:hypothetical protein
MQKGGTLGTHCQPRPIGTAIACEAEHGHRNQLADKPRCTRWDGTVERVAGPAAAHQGLLEEIWKLPRHRGGASGVCRPGLLERGGVRPGAQTPHYRTCIKGQGSNHIKIDRPQFDRAVVARGGDDHNHGASCAPKGERERGSEGERKRQDEKQD